MPGHLQQRMAEGRQTNGIIVLNDMLLLGDLIDDLATIWAATALEDHLNLMRYLPVSSWR